MQKFLTAMMVTVVTLAGSLMAADVPGSIKGHKTDAWRLHIKPTVEELAWMKIDWLPDLHSGIETASQIGKPILLWTMNGHPFGCT